MTKAFDCLINLLWDGKYYICKSVDQMCAFAILSYILLHNILQ